MKKVYLDNASTTKIDQKVIDAMIDSLQNDFGNASSVHSFGRDTKNKIELARKKIAKYLNANASEIIFTSGATEANNWILNATVVDLKIQRIITTKVEHHAVLHVVHDIQKKHQIAVEYLSVNEEGKINIAELVKLLQDKTPTLVSLMHVNNETGAMIDIEKIAKICKQNNALFHSDTVQSIGKFNFDLSQIPIDFLVASAHKFHGPKGVGFTFIRKGIAINSAVIGGQQEKGLRAGTESVHNIVGMATALELSAENFIENKKNIFALKKYCFDRLLDIFPTVKCNGGVDAFYNILNVTLPFSPEKTPLLLFNLDLKGIAVSRGSACQSGSSKASHVLQEMLNTEDLYKPSIRISISHHNTKDDIDYLLETLLHF